MKHIFDAVLQLGPGLVGLPGHCQPDERGEGHLHRGDRENLPGAAQPQVGGEPDIMLERERIQSQAQMQTLS